jgi:hypothetical protein
MEAVYRLLRAACSASDALSWRLCAVSFRYHYPSMLALVGCSLSPLSPSIKAQVQPVVFVSARRDKLCPQKRDGVA